MCNLLVFFGVMQAAQHPDSGSPRSEGLVDRIFDGLKHGGPPWTRHYGKSNIANGSAAPRLSRSGNLKRSLRKAKMVLDGSRFGSSRQNRKKASSERPLNHLSFFSRGLQGSFSWDSGRCIGSEGAVVSDADAPSTTLPTEINTKSDEDKENFQRQSAAPGGPASFHSPLRPLPIDLKQYVTGYEIKSGNSEAFSEGPAPGPVSAPLKIAFSTLVSDVLRENRNWINELALARRQKPWKFSQKSKMESDAFLEFLERLESLLKFESAFIEELHLRQDTLHEENTLLRHQLVAVRGVGLENHDIMPCVTSNSV